MLVGERMSHPVVTVSPKMPMQEAALDMRMIWKLHMKNIISTTMRH